MFVAAVAAAWNFVGSCARGWHSSGFVDFRWAFAFDIGAWRRTGSLVGVSVFVYHSLSAFVSVGVVGSRVSPIIGRRRYDSRNRDNRRHSLILFALFIAFVGEAVGTKLFGLLVFR
jgi:hypothetical protein